jgi:CTP synthase (UTP-ammonia lyase)
MNQTKYIFVTGGVTSSWKGIIAASWQNCYKQEAIEQQSKI